MPQLALSGILRITDVGIKFKVFELHSGSPYSCMDNLSAYPVLLSFLSYLKYFIGRLGSYPYQLVRGNIMSTDVDSSSIICANFGFWDSLPILADMAKAKLVFQVKSGAIHQQSSSTTTTTRITSKSDISPPILYLSSFKIYPHSRMTVQSLFQWHIQ